MKDGDKVLIECDNTIIKDKTSGLPYPGEKWDYRIDYNFIKLNSSNHITLHKSEEKMYTREDLEQAFEAGEVYGTCMNTHPGYGSPSFEKWFEQNIK